MKDRLKEHMEGWRFCEKCGMKLYQKIDGCSGTIHLKCHRCNTLLRIDLSFRRKKWSIPANCISVVWSASVWN